MHFDFSKQRVTRETLQLLFALTRACGLEAHRDSMFRGDKINVTEQRSVLHVALRAPRDAAIVEELYQHTMDVILRAEALERYEALPPRDIFDIGIEPAIFVDDQHRRNFAFGFGGPRQQPRNCTIAFGNFGR